MSYATRRRFRLIAKAVERKKKPRISKVFGRDPYKKRGKHGQRKAIQ